MKEEKENLTRLTIAVRLIEFNNTPSFYIAVPTEAVFPSCSGELQVSVTIKSQTINTVNVQMQCAD